MTRLILIIFLIPIFPFLSAAQPNRTDERVPPTPELKEVRTLAAAFYTDLHNSQDIGPLIPKYFVADFGRRLKLCWTKGCGGFGRDYWNPNEELISVDGNENDHRQTYINSINYFLVYFQAISYLASIEGKNLIDFEEAGGLEVNKRIEKKLKDKPEVLRLNFFSEPEHSLPSPDSPVEFRKRLADSELLIAAIRSINSDLRRELAKKRLKLRIILPTNFSVYKEPNKEGFFGFPREAMMYDVWPDGSSIFKIDMTREHGKLRIVAVYPAMD